MLACWKKKFYGISVTIGIVAKIPNKYLGTKWAMKGTNEFYIVPDEIEQKVFFVAKEWL